jgi:AraC-like DNA-binding protein
VSTLPVTPSRPLADRSGVRVVDYRCVARPGDRPFEERHDAACIAFVRSGSFTYRVGATRATLGPGSLLLGNPGQSYVCSHEHGGGDRCLSVSYAPALIEDVVAACGGRRSAHVFAEPALPARARTGALAQMLVAAARAEPGWSVEEVALELAACVLGEPALGGRPVPGGSGASERRAVAAMLYMDARSTEPLTLPEVARAAGLSVFHFLRSFRAALGVTPHQYLLRRRIAHAAEMLLETRAAITAIAYDVGFQDLANFIRTFHRAVGCSPRAFRAGRGLGRDHAAILSKYREHAACN